MANAEAVKAEDLIPVHSRVAWGPIFAGAVLALATYLLLTLVGTALGLSIHGRVSDRGLATGAVVWAVLVTAWSLLVGGFVASLFTTGENKFEGVVYGLIVWAVVFAMIVGLLAAGVRAGFGAMVGVANTAGSVAAANGNWEDLARRNGATDTEIARARADMSSAPASIRDAVNDPATRAAWYSALGTVLAMLAAGIGGYVGAGPTFRLVTVDGGPAPATRRRAAAVRT
jgi:hypothetical protein